MGTQSVRAPGSLPSDVPVIAADSSKSLIQVITEDGGSLLLEPSEYERLIAAGVRFPLPTFVEVRDYDQSRRIDRDASGAQVPDLIIPTLPNLVKF